MEDETLKMLRNSVQKLEDAKEELLRPEEDVVAWSVCTRVKQSLNGMLRSFLMFREVPVEEPASFSTLYELCKGQSPHFGLLNISHAVCNPQNAIASNEGCQGPTHCMTFEEYSRKVALAESVMGIVFSELELSAGDLA